MIVTGPNLERINKMPQNEDGNIGTRNRYSFCFVAILLLLVAIFATFMQKLCESNLAIARGNEVRMLMGTQVAGRLVHIMIMLPDPQVRSVALTRMSRL